MLPFREHGPQSASPVLLLLHFFGGSHREWDEVVALLDGKHRIVAADMPGFGEASGLTGFTVQEMADRLRELIEYLAPAPVVLVGHSMSGKAAMVVAAEPPANLTGLVLLAPSPLSGETMTEKQRAAMAVANTSRAGAEAFTTPGFYEKPSDEVYELAVADVLRASDEAFHAWPEHGTREDWSTRVTQLRVRSILVVGEEDKAITVEQQRRETLPLVEASGGRMHLLPDTAHLTPYERPAEIAAILDRFAEEVQ